MNQYGFKLGEIVKFKKTGTRGTVYSFDKDLGVCILWEFGKSDYYKGEGLDEIGRVDQVRCVRAGIYKDSSSQCDCSNRGISKYFTEVLVPVKDGHIAVETEDPPDNLCCIIRRNICGREYVHIEPWTFKANGVWSMFGGSFAYSCDSRFNETINNGGYPVAIHDRVEK